MNLSGESRIPASREHVWALLNDPEVLGRCIPGCEGVESAGEDAFSARVLVKVGPMKARFTGAVTLQDKHFPESYRIVGEGQGGIAGFAKGSAAIRLAAEAPGVTLLSYDVESQVGGKMAQFGSRLIDSAAKKLAEQFFERFSAAAAEKAAA